MGAVSPSSHAGRAVERGQASAAAFRVVATTALQLAAVAGALARLVLLPAFGALHARSRRKASGLVGRCGCDGVVHHRPPVRSCFEQARETRSARSRYASASSRSEAATQYSLALLARRRQALAWRRRAAAHGVAIFLWCRI